MIYYFLPTFAFFIASIKLLNIKNTKIVYNFLFFFMFIYYLMFVGLRGEGIGTDYYAYGGFFRDPSITEPFFGLFINIVKVFTEEYKVFVFVNILLTLLLRNYFFSKYSNNMAISYLMLSGFWIIVYDMNGVRQALSLGFVGLASIYAYREKLLGFILFTLVATLIHYSSAIFFIFIFFLKLNINRKNMLIIIIFLYALALLNLSGFIMDFLMKLGLGGVFIDRVTTYSGISEYNRNIAISFNTFHRIAIFLLVIYTIRFIPCEQRLKKILVNAAFLNLAIYLLLSRFEIIAIRGSLPFRYFELIYFSYFPYISKKKQVRIFLLFLLYCYVCLQIYQTLSASSSNDVDNTLLPYRTIFE